MNEHDAPLMRLVDQVRAAGAAAGALDIRGHGSKAFYGGPACGEALDMRTVAGISRHEASELVISARAGTPLAELEATLAAAGQCLPFEPPRFAAQGSVGGMVAAGLSGPARATSGAVRDYVLGVTMINGRGEVLSFGGQVMKNVAGYDVSRLLVGSLGVLGVICEVSLKVLPLAPAEATLCFALDETAALDRLHAWARQPLPLNASAWFAGKLYLRLRGAQAAVHAACRQLGGAELAPEQAAAWWDGVRDQTHSFFRLADEELQRGERLWRLSLPATTAPLSLPGTQFIEWGGALRWWRSDADADAMRTAAAARGGHATLFRGADKSAGTFAPLAAPLLDIHRRLKLAFDPLRLFNRGRLYAEL